MNFAAAISKSPADVREELVCSHDRRRAAAFSLIEIMIVVSLLSLIVLALMQVFSSTQTAFRASVTQTDVLEGGRAAVGLISADLRQMSPSSGFSNGAVNLTVGPTYSANYPLFQKLPGSSAQRTNLLNYFFFISRENTKWTGVGYAVNAASASPLYPLYRFYAETNVIYSPRTLFSAFTNDLYFQRWTNLSRVVDGVINLKLRAYDASGVWLTDNYTNIHNATFFAPAFGEAQFYFFSNTVPASVELQLGVMEDRPLQHAESLPFQSPAQAAYLSQQAGRVHVFRQIVTIPNVDPAAYK